MSDIPLPNEHHDAEQKRYHDFFNLAIILSFLTMLELVLIFLPFVKGVLFWTLVVLSLVKFFTVIFIFMHLIYDKMMYTILFMAGLVIATGTVIALVFLFSPSRAEQNEGVDINAVPESVSSSPGH